MMQMDARRMPYEAEFDVIGAFDVLEHVADDGAVLAGMRKALAPGGGIIVSVPQHPWLWSGVDDYSHHFRRYTRPQLIKKIGDAGFSIAHVTSFMTLVLPAMIVSRFLTRDAASLDPAAELKAGRLTNAVCSALCACELWPVAGGWSLPIGGSLLAIARKAE
jgi:SAM-dependent methyltransferase